MWKRASAAASAVPLTVDVHQGYLGDCYFASALALLATAGAVVTVPMTKKRRGTAGERPGSLGAQHGVQRSSTAIKSRLGGGAGLRVFHRSTVVDRAAAAVPRRVSFFESLLQSTEAAAAAGAAACAAHTAGLHARAGQGLHR